MSYIVLLKDFLTIPALFQPYALFSLRILVGLVFLLHGAPKINDIKKTGDNFEMMGFRPGVLWGTLIALLEVVGGFAMIFGLFAQVFATLFAIEMLVATIKVKRGMGFVNGYELDLLLFAACLVLLTTGSGMLSVDRILLGL